MQSDDTSNSSRTSPVAEGAASSRSPATARSPVAEKSAPLQFNLRTLLVVVTLVAVILALTQWFSPIVVAAIFFVALSILGHVAGNAIGTKLRRQGQQLHGQPDPVVITSKTAPPKAGFAQPTQLAHSKSLGWPILAISASGVMIGGTLGGWWSIVSGGDKANAFTIGVGVLALAMIGGMVAFVAGSFLQVAISSLWHALDAPQPLHRDEPAPPRNPDVQDDS